MATTQGIRIDEKTTQRLRALAEKRDRTPHWLMRDAIERYLNSEERYEQERQEDMERWERYVLTGNAMPSDKVNTWLAGLADRKAST